MHGITTTAIAKRVLGIALKGNRDKAVLMTKVCTHGRGKEVAMRQLEESLRRLQTDHLDVWQIHEVIYENDPDLIFGPGGAAEALLQAKQQGKVRAIGFTGHKDPSIHLRMLSHNFPFDTVQMPLNCLDATFRSFETQVLPEARKQGIAVLGMKSMGGSGEIVTHGAATPQEALRYAMSLPVGHDHQRHGIQGDPAAEPRHRPRLPADVSGANAVASRSLPLSCVGRRFELFKTTKKYDGGVGRQQHHFPSAEELPA